MIFPFEGLRLTREKWIGMDCGIWEDEETSFQSWGAHVCPSCLSVLEKEGHEEGSHAEGP